jgi:FKBP-type peptidyl-prolyl cis-trans isomerase
MKKVTHILLIVILGAFVGAGFVYWQNSKNKLSKKYSPEQWGSYALGAKYAEDIKNQGIKIDIESFNQGVEDAVADKIKLNRQELTQFETQFREKMSGNMNELAKKNDELAKEFLQQNSNRQGVKTTKSGLQYLVIEEGHGESAKLPDWVETSYEVRLLDGKLLEASSPNGKQIEIPVKMGLPVLEEAFQMMKPNSHYRIFAPPALAYGKFPRPGIPANSLLVFDIKLSKVINKESSKAITIKK